MPWIIEGSKEVEHSWPVKEKYARAAREHRERSVSLWPMLVATVGLIAAYACIFYLLIE